MKVLSVTLLFGLLLPCAGAADLTGTWRAELARRGGVTLPLYLILRQEGDKLEGHIIAPAGGDLPLLHPHFEGPDAVFSTKWGMSYHLRPEGEKLRVAVTYEWRERDDTTAVRVPASEVSSPPPLPLPALRTLPSNGLALTPPMGWNSWNHFGEQIDDRTVREIADALVDSGMAAAGYVFVNIDDTWEGGRDPRGNLVPNAKFPDMKALADYLHGRGLRLGLYSSPGVQTCAGYAGGHGHEEQDAKTFARWGVDYLKYDWCGAGEIYGEADQRAVCQRMGEALARCGRPIIYSLSIGGEVWTWGAMAGANLWRTTGDIQDNWRAMAEIGFNQHRLAPFAGPGHWNDPDMLEVGNGGMTTTEYRTHFSLWCLLAAPLLAGNDLRHMSAETLALLTNRELIAVDQDSLGQQGVRLGIRDGIEIWAKPLRDGSRAVGLFNRGEQEQRAALAWTELGLAGKPRLLRDLWLHQDLSPTEAGFSGVIPAHGVIMLRVH